MARSRLDLRRMGSVAWLGSCCLPLLAAAQKATSNLRRLGDYFRIRSGRLGAFPVEQFRSGGGRVCVACGGGGGGRGPAGGVVYDWRGGRFFARALRARGVRREVSPPAPPCV